MEDLTKKFTGKKLLLLGTNTGTCDMVNYARSHGAYTIVTDNLPPEKSAAKTIADEAWLISTAEVDTLEKLAFQQQVNGIFAGASEFNLEKALTLCERLGLPFYCTREQWNICSNKLRFKQLCLANGIPVAKEYTIGANDNLDDLKRIEYPVIVKPVDSGGAKGIGICQSENDLLRLYSRAVSLSKTRQAIIEDFIEGDETEAGYTVKDGEFSLSCTTDRYSNPDPHETIHLQQASIWPSKHTDQCIAKFNAKIINMFKSIGITNGFIFVQAIVNKNGFYFTEANYRMAGSPWYQFLSRINGINHMEMLVNHALTGKMDGYDLSLDNPWIDNKYCCNLVLASRGGVVGNIKGLEEVKDKKNLIGLYKLHDIGDYIENSGSLNQAVLRFYLIEDTLQEMKKSIQEIQGVMKVLDDNGHDMLLPPFNIARI
jgi:biotin carboxylase